MGLESEDAEEYLSRDARERHYQKEDREEIEEYRNHPEHYLRDQERAFTVGEIVADVYPAGSGERLEDVFDAVNKRDEEYRGMENPSAAGQNAKARFQEFKKHYRNVKKRLDQQVENGPLERFELAAEEVREEADLDIDALSDLERPHEADTFVFYIHEDNL
ncbi:MAG: hypothetical protein SVU32_07025 [Candidatus Nanohaloarchaea archaeon]|nr:hypothetical protein [Candidatus Nanohaloarchaea archaeon]